MKKSILIIFTLVTAFSLMAFGYINWGNSETDKEEISCNNTFLFDCDLVNTGSKLTDIDLFYDVSSRFIATVTKENLNKAKSIIDILPKKATQSIESYQAVTITILHRDKETSEIGDGDVLNTAQIKLLQSTDYSTNIFIRANYSRKNAIAGELEDEYLIYYMTIIPEKEAEFISGQDALLEYLKENLKEKTAIIKQDQLKPGKVSFTITKKGRIENVKLTSTSGYISVDKALVELITTMPEKWNPATNSKGEKVDQELVLFFGLKGC